MVSLNNIIIIITTNHKPQLELKKLKAKYIIIIKITYDFVVGTLSTMLRYSMEYKI